MSNDEPLVIPETLLIQLAEGRVEEMPLEEYLKGVVPTEMGLQKPIEALKAQAIAARSFAVGTRRHASEGFDVCITTHCQVYKPKNRYADSDRSVDETAGQVLSHASGVTGAPFFAHCDGHTRSAQEAWSKDVSFLRSVPCICGYDELYGHGVGMCQRGAAAMAREGATVKEILAHYYSGTGIAEAMPMPRNSFRRSVILGHVVDQHGHPQFGIPLVLTGVEGGMVRRTNELGQFWISGLRCRNVGSANQRHAHSLQKSGHRRPQRHRSEFRRAGYRHADGQHHAPCLSPSPGRHVGLRWRTGGHQRSWGQPGYCDQWIGPRVQPRWLCYPIDWNRPLRCPDSRPDL